MCLHGGGRGFRGEAMVILYQTATNTIAMAIPGREINLVVAAQITIAIVLVTALAVTDTDTQVCIQTHRHNNYRNTRVRTEA